VGCLRADAPHGLPRPGAGRHRHGRSFYDKQLRPEALEEAAARRARRCGCAGTRATTIPTGSSRR
jgi:hypothetical protein